MEKYLEVQEDTEFYSGRVLVMESLYNPGMALIQVWMSDKTNGVRDSAGIRLTREQARQVGQHLLDLADELLFEEQRANANE
ncbi:hypothetical protein EXT67_20700 [Pectobacterium atrosepticum]|uniref:Uncharacterized protein n=1 Tax=Pectobacterium phage phiTE TaxID=1116482 RepID=K9L518_9CAUD|nr:hypothetical protein [Pectobacterium atrosepticum]YP_007392511.1 hypothetical protein phiTE_049 [Pectobacterium phage phiTE]AEZ66215.1 hypothetical protein phiTE_049 [Pectobacterium phage phiTE]MCL6318725.1 hypothetical protein [Pectobacterium atrosepticum]